MGVVGGLIVGQAAVDAHLVSTIVVIVVALTAIATFSIPNELFTSAFRLMKFFLIILCAFWGLYGFFLGFLAMFIHLFYLEIMEFHMHIQWLKKEEDYPQHSGFYGSLFHLKRMK